MCSESDESDVILEIPTNFERNLIRELSAELMISADAVNGVKGGLGTSYLNSIIREYNSDIQLKLIHHSEKFAIPNLEIVPLYRYNTSLQYDSPSNVDMNYLFIFGIIAGFILITASINYINLHILD